MGILNADGFSWERHDPVVASKSGAIPEIVEDGRTGLLTPVLDVWTMAEAIQVLANDASRRREMGSAARLRVRDHFSIDSAVQKTMRVYESMWRSEEPAT